MSRSKDAYRTIVGFRLRARSRLGRRIGRLATGPFGRCGQAVRIGRSWRKVFLSWRIGYSRRHNHRQGHVEGVASQARTTDSPRSVAYPSPAHQAFAYASKLRTSSNWTYRESGTDTQVIFGFGLPTRIPVSQRVERANRADATIQAAGTRNRTSTKPPCRRTCDIPPCAPQGFQVIQKARSEARRKTKRIPCGG